MIAARQMDGVLLEYPSCTGPKSRHPFHSFSVASEECLAEFAILSLFHCYCCVLLVADDYWCC